MSRHDYLPFGEELFAPTGGRTTAQGYTGGDGIRQQFTSKERDIETGFDYFGARYYSALQGRFVTPDPLLSSGRSYEPQSWNRYTYVLNRSLGLVDPTGLDWGVATWTDEDGNKHTNYHYFEGEIGEYKGKVYTAVNFGSKGFEDVRADGGAIIRISNLGNKRQIVYSPPSGGGESEGQDTLDLGAGLVHGLPLIGHTADWAGGVERNSTAYKNGETISSSVALFAVIMTGGGGPPGCLTNVSGGALLYRAVTAGELASIQRTGTYTVGAGQEGKYFFTSAESAASFSRMMQSMRPQEGSYTITSVQADRAVIEASTPIKAAGEGPAYYVPQNQLPLGPVKIWNWSPNPPR